MTKTMRPRVTAIGLDDPMVASIAPLCGDLRETGSLNAYLHSYSLTETDVVVLSSPAEGQLDRSVNLMTIGPTSVNLPGYYLNGSRRQPHYVRTNTPNTERELAVPPACPDIYRPLAAELSRRLGQAAEPPTVIDTSWRSQTRLIETTSGRPVAVQLALPPRSSGAKGESSRAIAILLPEAANLLAWFRAFLCELHESDPSRVPQAPSRFSQPSDWYTPQERLLADRISQIKSELERLSDERDQLQTNLADEEESADRGIRRALWADGDDLIAAVQDMLTGLKFTVRDMDAELKQGQQKREDLRLTLRGVPGWQAIVEVKGYPSGTKTNDARQIREHRDLYTKEEGRYPDLTVWLANSYRTMDPSSKPAPDQNVKDAAENIGAVHVLVSDLYRQWALVAAGSLDAETVVQSLVNAEPGLWAPPAPSSGT